MLASLATSPVRACDQIRQNHRSNRNFLPKTTCRPFNHGRGAKVIKNWDEFVFFPKLTILNKPRLSCNLVNVSSDIQHLLVLNRGGEKCLTCRQMVLRIRFDFLCRLLVLQCRLV